MAEHPEDLSADACGDPIDDRRATTRESREFDDVYRTWSPVVWRAARSRLPCDADADGATQDVFLRLWRRGPEAWRPKNPENFFRRAGHNEAVTRLRRGGNEIPLTPELVADLESSVVEPDSIAARNEVRESLNEALGRLPSRCGLVMSLIAAGFSHPEIAERLGMSVHAVEKQATRGKRAIAKACRQFEERS